MNIWYKSLFGLFALIILTGCSSTMTSQTQEPVNAAPTARQETSPEQPVVTVAVTKAANEADETPAEGEMSSTESRTDHVEQNPFIEMAVTDLANRLNISSEEILVVSFEAVIWPDNSMGCPQPGMAYLQVLQEGSLIQLSVEGQMYEYHSGGNREPFLCEKTSNTKSTPLPADDFAPPPGEDMDK